MDMDSIYRKGKSRIIIYLLPVILLWSLVLIFTYHQYTNEKDHKARELNIQLQMFNHFLLSNLEDGHDIDSVVKNYKTFTKDIRITLILKDGKVAFDNKVNINDMENHLDRKEIQTAMKNGSGFIIRRLSETNNIQYFYSATMNDKYIIRSALPYSVSLQNVLKANSTICWMVIGLTFAITMVIIMLINTVKQSNINYIKFLEQEQDKIRIKRQLTNNINHELKTPVASIQVCLETLINNDCLPKDIQAKMIDRCYQSCQRLRNLLRDISLITRIEEGSNQIEKEDVNINYIINDLKEELGIYPPDKRMKLIDNFDEKVNIKGNTSLLVSIFRNLTENAISYSGGDSIIISLLENNDDECKISFEDNGNGVNEKHLPHLFERFYRVDKGRSRQTGGTGLGLAIVKHSVLYHGGNISVSNRKEGGLAFVFTLKKN